MLPSSARELWPFFVRSARPEGRSRGVVRRQAWFRRPLQIICLFKILARFIYRSMGRARLACFRRLAQCRQWIGALLRFSAIPCSNPRANILRILLIFRR